MNAKPDEIVPSAVGPITRLLPVSHNLSCLRRLAVPLCALGILTLTASAAQMTGELSLADSDGTATTTYEAGDKVYISLKDSDRNGDAVTEGSVVGVYVGNELRGQQEVVLSDGKSYVTLVASLAGEERVSFRIWEAQSDKEYAVTKTLTMAKGETHGTPTELLKLNGLVASVGVRILSYTRSPFGIEFESELGREYVVESTGDLKEWKPVRALQGSSERTRFTPGQEPKATNRYFRVKRRN